MMMMMLAGRLEPRQKLDLWRETATEPAVVAMQVRWWRSHAGLAARAKR